MQFDHVWIMVSPNAPERAALERAGFEIAKEVNRLPGGVPRCAILFAAVEDPAGRWRRWVKLVHCRSEKEMQNMRASALYRIAAILLLLFDIGHTLGFRQSDPQWGVDALLDSMRSIHFDMQGFSRTYWDLFVGAGFFVSMFLLFAAVLAWQLGGLSAETLRLMRPTGWALALCFVGVTILSWRYFFMLPIVFLTLITVCLVAAAWRSAKAS
jgi:hypothetical protein